MAIWVVLVREVHVSQDTLLVQIMVLGCIHALPAVCLAGKSTMDAVLLQNSGTCA